MTEVSQIPLSLYIHFPWCVKKCPYCDFNSHLKPDSMPEQAYIARLIEDLDQALPDIWGRRVSSIFMGGGTPSLFHPDHINTLLEAIRARIPFAGEIEITMEANPGTVDAGYFKGFKQAGINRLSIGIQSFDDRQLKALGRIHDSSKAQHAIETAYQAGFTNLNLDLMHGLAEQSLEQALHDLTIALSFKPQHLSWYQLTIEPNTVFYKTPPILPDDDRIAGMQQQGWQLLQQHGFHQYEISAFSQAHRQAQHNLNYWQFGDYLGLGAGAHSKLSDRAMGTITRFSKLKQPKDYLNPAKAFKTAIESIEAEQRPFEFMLNALRLTQAIPWTLFEQRTFLTRDRLQPFLQQAQAQTLFTWDDYALSLTPLGQRFSNEAMALFLPHP